MARVTLVSLSIKVAKLEAYMKVIGVLATIAATSSVSALIFYVGRGK